MGINGLLKGLQSFSKKRHITDFENHSLAVDASSWLHKSVYSISEKYVEAAEHSKKTHDPSCVKISAKYMISRCTELLDHGAKIKSIYLVMDGKRCPLKAQTNDDREERRTNNLKDARRYKKERKNEQAQEKYKACIKIHSAFADAVAEEIQSHFARNRDKRVHIVRSPYEADSQLVKLCVDGFTQAIVTEDSDVLVYCAACHISVPILYKLERRGANAGACDVISMDWLLNPKLEEAQSKNDSKKKDSSLNSILKSLCSRQRSNPGKGIRLFVQACVLAGSDYSPSLLEGVGLVTAFKIVRDQSHKACDERFHHVLEGLTTKQAGKVDMYAYEMNLARSEAVFYFHPVLQLCDKKIMHLNNPQISNAENVSDFSPCLDRFGHDHWFLGRLDGRDPTDLRSPALATRIIVNEPAAPMTTIFVRKVPGKKRQREAITDSETKGHDYGEEETSKIIKIVNPYAKDKSRQPLASVDTNRQFQSSQSNQFASFAHNKTFLADPTHQRGDVRFAKRIFSKDGKPPMKFIDYAKAKAALSRPQHENARPQVPNAVSMFAKSARQANCNPPRDSDDAFEPLARQCQNRVVDVDEEVSSVLRHVAVMGRNNSVHQDLPPFELYDSNPCKNNFLYNVDEGDSPLKSAFLAPDYRTSIGASNGMYICSDDNDYHLASKFFASSRRVTLDSPMQEELEEFRTAGDGKSAANHVALNPNLEDRYTASSPGELTALSDIEDLAYVGASMPTFRRPADDTPGNTSDGFNEVVMRGNHNATPFQTDRTFADIHRGHSKTSHVPCRPTVSKPRSKKPSPLASGFELQIAKHASSVQAKVPQFPVGRRGLDIRRISYGGIKPKTPVNNIRSFFGKAKASDDDLWDDC
jgi:5'-3' exonuclease